MDTFPLYSENLQIKRPTTSWLQQQFAFEVQKMFFSL